MRACTLWYHAHTLGITRLNVYAGLAGFYLLRDRLERSLNLPCGPMKFRSSYWTNHFIQMDRSITQSRGENRYRSLGYRSLTHF